MGKIPKAVPSKEYVASPYNKINRKLAFLLLKDHPQISKGQVQFEAKAFQVKMSKLCLEKAQLLSNLSIFNDFSFYAITSKVARFLMTKSSIVMLILIGTGSETLGRIIRRSLLKPTRLGRCQSEVLRRGQEEECPGQGYLGVESPFKQVD